MHFADDPVTAVAALPALALVLPLFVLVSGVLEYVFPPYWGDMFMLLGFFLTGQPSIPVSPWTVYLAAFVGSCLGAALAYTLGQHYGLRVARRVVPWRPTGSRERIRQMLSRFGERFLLFNRFVPIIRGLLLYGAGAMRLRFADSMLYSALSNLVWVAILMGFGLLTAGSWDEILATFREVHRVLGAIAGVAVVGWIVFVVWRLRVRQESA